MQNYGTRRPNLTRQFEEDVFLFDAQKLFYGNTEMEERAVLCFLLCNLYYVPRVTETRLKIAWTKHILITSLSLLPSFSVPGAPQASGILGT